MSPNFIQGGIVPGEADFGICEPFPLVDGDTIRIWYVCGPYTGPFGFFGRNIGRAQMPAPSLSR